MRLLRQIVCVLASLFCLAASAFAQQTFKINGIIFKKGSSTRVSQATITDLNSKTIMMSDDLGMFSINIAVGDTLLIIKKEFAPFKITVDNNADLLIGLQPMLALKEVVITGQTKRQELNEVMRQYNSKGIYNNGNSLPFFEFLNSPLTGFYNLFGKTPREERHFAALAQTELQNTEIDKRYTKELVKNITKLPDEEVTKFMQIYTPSYQDIKEWNDYQLIQYIRKNFAFYQRNKNRQHVQQLPKIEAQQQKE
jgi:hypothetical protein